MLVPPVSRYMSLRPQVVDVRTTLSAARLLMRSQGFHHLPVVDPAGNLVGVLSDRNMPFVPDTLVGEVMTEDIITVAPEDDIDDVVERMTETACSSVVVVSKTGIEGIFTTHDGMRALLDVLRAAVTEGGHHDRNCP